MKLHRRTTWLHLGNLKLTRGSQLSHFSQSYAEEPNIDANHCESKGGTCLFNSCHKTYFQNHKARASLAQSVGGVNCCRFVDSFEFTWFCNHIHFSLDDLSCSADITVTSNQCWRIIPNISDLGSQLLRKFSSISTCVGSV